MCMTCTVPVVAARGGKVLMARACGEGPVFNASRVLWDRWLGAPGGAAPEPSPDEIAEPVP